MSRAGGWLRYGSPLSRAVRSVAYLINLHSIALCALGCAAVAACDHLDIRFGLDVSVVVFGVTFSVTFTITQAYQRRERAIVTLAELKATVIALYWQHRDWGQGPTYPESLGDDNTLWAREFAAVAMDFLTSLQAYIVAREGYESIAEVRLAARRNATAHILLGRMDLPQGPDLGDTFVARVQSISDSLPGQPYLMRAYSALSKISVMNEYLTHKARYLRGGEGGMSRSAQYLRYLIAQMEQLRMVKVYRTPVMLRNACSVLTHALTVLLAPYFLHAGTCDEGSAWAGRAACPAPYVMACLWVLVTTLLLNVQASNECPLDMTGADDIFFELPTEFSDVLTNSTAHAQPICDDGECFNAWRAQFDARWREAAGK